MDEKKFIITSEQREEILSFIRSRNYQSARNSLNQLKTLEEYLKEEKLKEQEVNNGDSK